MKMKKEYKNPSIEIIEMELQQVIASSDFGEGTKPGGEAATPELEIYF